MRPFLAIAVAVTACATNVTPPVTTDPNEVPPPSPGDGSGGGGGGGAEAIPDVRCEGVPDAGPAGSFNHFSSSVISYGSAAHRGIDLIVPASAATQTISGTIAYTIADKALEDEDVDLFACRAGAWQKLGTARTDNEGRFALALADADRLPIGMRDLYVSVVGDRTGSEFLAVVAPDGTKLFVSDVDGTLTSSENAFAEWIVIGGDIDARAGAAAAYSVASTKGYIPVYLTARGDHFTDPTRSWLAGHGFPRGPLRLSPGLVTLPGSATIDFKTQSLVAFGAGLVLAAGVGNRASDVQAYTNAGVAADRIFIELPDYQDEVQADLDAQRAIGFQTYDELRTGQIDGM